MTSGMPELGSKISLISKADIRYEGRLFTVDPAECTIALANVRSYGTEDRETQFPISPQNQVYDYILFRGSDIKDIRVVNNVAPMPNDPAIMQMQLPTQQMVGGQQGFQPQQFPVPVMGHMGAQMGQFGGTYNAMAGLSGLTAAGLAPGSNLTGSALHKTKQASELNIAIPEPSSATQAEHKDQASVLDLIGGGSRSTTPISLHSRKSPTAEIGVQVNKSGNSTKDGSRRNNQNRGQRERRDSGNQVQAAHEPNTRQQQQRNNQQPQQQPPQQFHGNNQNRGWSNRGGNQNQGGPQLQGQGQGQGGNNGGGGNMRGQRPRGRGPPMQQGGFRQNMHNQNSKGQRPKTTIKFESDYDFEQANNKFEELRLELAKLKVGEEAKPEQVNGETDKKDDSGNETGAGEHEQEDDEVTVGYDKTKSFFDNISCEAATDRTKGKNRTDWRHERKINSETFGVSARRGGFYSFRGRGGGYFNRNNMNNGTGGGYRGGSGGYRGGGGGGHYRGRNFNNRNYNQSSGTGIPQQLNKPEQPSGGTGNGAGSGADAPVQQPPTVTAGGN